MKIPVLAFSGRAKTGKTTLIERLLSLLTTEGIRTAAVKHHRGDFDIDREGKDSYRYKQAGARLSMIVSPNKLALVQDLGQEPTLEAVLHRYVSDVDLVILEGYKQEQIPKIEVYNSRTGAPPLLPGDKDLIAIVSDIPLEADVPVFLRDNTQAIARFIIEKFKLGK